MEKRSAEKPITTESPLKSIPLPDMRNVFEIASSSLSPSRM